MTTTKDKKTESKTQQYRIEHIFYTELEGDQLDEFTKEIIDEFRTHLQPEKGEKHLLTQVLNMDDVSQDETDRLQAALVANLGEMQDD